MFAKDLIDDVITPVKLSDNCLQIITWMEENKVAELPVVENKVFYGLISEQEIYNLQEPDVSVDEVKNRLRNISVNEYRYFADVLYYITKENLTLLPVLDKQSGYSGVITQRTLIQGLARLTNIYHPGAVLVLEVHQSDYMLSQIGQIAEMNDVKILNILASPHKDSMIMDVILKTNSQKIDSLISTFERYEYTVKATFSEENFEWEELKEHYDYMMNYLNI